MSIILLCLVGINWALNASKNRKYGLNLTTDDHCNLLQTFCVYIEDHEACFCGQTERPVAATWVCDSL